MKTVDGGNSWNYPYTVNNNTLRSVFFIDNNNGYAVGDKGTFIKTKDGGLSWTGHETDSIVDLYSVCFTSVNNGYAIGDKGTILRTSDGGKTWKTQNSDTDVNLNAVHFINSDNGFVIGEEGLILKTTDRGTTWIKMNSNTTYDLMSMYFLDANVGFIVGMQGTILKTENGGNDWVDKYPDINIPLIAVYFKDRQNGIALDNKRSLLKTTDGGNNWEFENSGLVKNLRSVYFLNDNTFYAVSARNSRLLKFTGHLKGEKQPDLAVTQQKQDSVKVPKKKIVKLGLALGLTNVSFKIENYSRLGDNPNYQPSTAGYNANSVNEDSFLNAHTDYAMDSPGVKIGVVSEMMLHNNISLRMIPGLLFWEEKVYFNVPVFDINRFNDEPSDITNYYKILPTFIDLPVLFKFQSEHVFNRRPYLIVGGSYQRNISQSGREEIIRISEEALNGEIGIGMNNHLKLTNLAVELKASFGLHNMLEDININTPQNKFYSQSIKSFTINMITLSFMFE